MGGGRFMSRFVLWEFAVDRDDTDTEGEGAS